MNSTETQAATLSQLETRLNELEVKLAFQDDLLNTLDEVITKQDKEIQDLWSANRLLKQSLGELKEGNTAATHEPPPPHY